MAFMQKIHDRIEGLERKIFYRYLIILSVCMALAMAAIIYFFYSSVHDLENKINDLNELRTSEVKKILSRMKNVQKQQKEVDDILAKDPSFKIGGYFAVQLAQLGIAENKKEETISQVNLSDEKYRESVLRATFTGLTMQQLCRLLNIIEQNPRVYTKALEIQRAKNKTIDVTLTIGTLQLRTAAPE